MSNIYDQHKAAFANVSAYVVFNGANERVASIAFRFPKDGAGRLYAYVHWFGIEMVRGFAAGGGYDKRSAACAEAAVKVDALRNSGRKEDLPQREVFILALAQGNSGYSWDRELENRGFKVFQAV